MGGIDRLSLSYSYYLTLAHVNLNCITNKIVHVSNLLYTNKIDILCVSETWLNPVILDSVLSIKNYDIVRMDSPSGVRKHGVAIYIKCGLPFDIFDVNAPNVIVISLSNYNIFVVYIYIDHPKVALIKTKKAC